MNHNKLVPTMHSSVNTASQGLRRPPRSPTAPKTGLRIAISSPQRPSVRPHCAVPIVDDSATASVK